MRCYEQVALIPFPPRSPSWYRQYSAEHSKRLQFLRHCRDLGFSISEIRGLLSKTEGRNRPCGTVTRLAAGDLKDVRSKMFDLRRLERALGALVASCSGGR
jgi:MerR family transcriptional regulator, mercuric resistance operon regulatory protein